MKQLKQSLLAVLMVIVFALPAWAFVPSGELNAGLTVEWDEAKEQLVHSSTRTGFRLVLEDDLDFSGKLHLSGKGWWDVKEKDGEISLDQFWLAGYAGDADYSLGRQVISWGTADGFNATDYFSRMSLDSLFSGDLTSDPIWAGQATYYAPSWSLSGVVQPYFEPQKIDGRMVEMMPEVSLPEGLPPFAADFLPDPEDVLGAIDQVPKPKGLRDNLQWAVRAETRLAGFDFQASYFSGLEPLPMLEVLISGLPFSPQVDYLGEYRRQHFVGLAATGTLGYAGIWGEISYGGPTTSPGNGDLEGMRVSLSNTEKYMQAVVGGDYTFDLGQGLLVQAQYIFRGQGSLFAPYVLPELEMDGFLPAIEPGEVKAAHYLYGRFGYDFSPESSFDAVLLHGFEEEGGLIRPAFSYRFPSTLQLELSLIKTYGKEGAAFKSIPLQARLAFNYKF